MLIPWGESSSKRGEPLLRVCDVQQVLEKLYFGRGDASEAFLCCFIDAMHNFLNLKQIESWVTEDFVRTTK